MEIHRDLRIAGVLVPVFALRGAGDQGIGDTWSLMEFIPWAADHGFAVIQMLPINETGGDNSPYNAISAFALDPVLLRVTAEALPDLPAEPGAAGLADTGGPIDYAVVKQRKLCLLEQAYANFYRQEWNQGTERAEEFQAFIDREGHWLADYALYRTLIDTQHPEHQGDWTSWPEHHGSSEAARAWLGRQTPEVATAFANRMLFFQYVQWVADSQWRVAKACAAGHGVALMGDIPYAVSRASADVWAQPQLFRLDWSAGTPPEPMFQHDDFVRKWGQNWGMPLYDWEAMQADGHQWWRRRVRAVRAYFDLFRIDHVLGFFRIYAFPWHPLRNAEFLALSPEEAKLRNEGREPHFELESDEHPEGAQRNRARGEAILRIIADEAGSDRVIGEDLGFLPPYIKQSMAALGLAGYRIPHWEHDVHHQVVPGRDYPRWSVTTYGTHDHDPLAALWKYLSSHAATDNEARRGLSDLCTFAGITAAPGTPFTPEIQEALLKALFDSNAWLAVLQMGDVLGRVERINLPGTSSSANWTARLHAPIAELDADDTARRIARLIEQSGRKPRA